MILTGFKKTMPSNTPKYDREYYRNKRSIKDGRASMSQAKERRRAEFLEQFPNYFELLQNLPERDRKIILGFYLEGRPLSYFAKTLGISRQRVQAIRDEAIKNITDYYDNSK